MEGNLKIHQFFGILKKRLLLILSISIGLSVLSGIYALYIMKPIYESSVQILINENAAKGDYDYSSVSANFQYINTYSDFITAPVVIEKVIDDLDLNLSYEELVSQVKVTSNKESQIITIFVDNQDYSMAVTTANKISQVFKQEVKKKLYLNNVTILSPANEKSNPQPINSSPVTIIFVAFLTGIILGYGISFLLEMLDNTIKTKSDIDNMLHIHTVGEVSTIQPKDVDTKNIQYSEILVKQRSKSKAVGGKSI